MPNIPMRGDRSAHNDIDYPELHAADLDASTPIHHLPSAALDQLPLFDGSKWVAVDKSTVGGGGGGDIYLFFDGALVIGESVIPPIIAARNLTVASIAMHVAVPGTSGSTTIDIKLNGVTMFSSNTKPTVAYDDVNKSDERVPNTTAITKGSIITLGITSVATGAQRLSVCIVLAGSSGSSGGGSGDMLTSVYDPDADGSVLAADSVPWSGVTDTPATYPPEAHTHDYAASNHTHTLDALGTPSDITDLNATTEHHGLLPKLGGGTTNFLRADGAWAEPPGSGEGGGGGGVGWQELTDAENIAWDLANGSGKVTLAGSRTLSNPTNGAAGQVYTLQVAQDSVGGRILSYGNAYRHPNGIRPPLSVQPSSVDEILFIHDGTYMNQVGLTKNLKPSLAFDPRNLSGCLVWLSADTLAATLSDGTQVEYWENLAIPTNSLSQGTATAKPVLRTSAFMNSRPSVQFDGVNDYMLFGSAVTGMRTVFMVLYQYGGTGNFKATLGGTATIDFHGGEGNALFHPSYTSGYITGGSIRYNGVTVAVAANRPSSPTILSIVTTGGVSSNALAIDRGYGERYWVGPMAEIIAYNAVLSTANINSVLTYLSDKYAISVTLIP